jgi:L-amino acid N-acyltransferase YncA
LESFACSKARLHKLRNKGVKCAVVGVQKQNLASRAVQKALGFRVFEETENWKKLIGDNQIH